MALKVGDVVKLKSGGDTMTVLELSKGTPGSIKTAWFAHSPSHGYSSTLATQWFDQDALYLMPQIVGEGREA